MDKRMKNGIVLAVAIPLLGYFCYDIYKQVFPSRPAGGDVPASMEQLPKLPQSQAPAIPKPNLPAPAANPQTAQNTQNPAAKPLKLPNMANQNAQQPQPAPTSGKPQEPAKTEGENKPIVLASASIFGENPFVEMQVLSEEKRMEQSMLPAIPHNTPVPAVSNIPIPPPPEGVAIPTPPGGGSSAPTVTGFIESSNGDRIALMSDGKVVNEGDTLNGDQIAYIGGGSVQFDNGKTLELINSIEVKRNQ